MSRLCPPGRRWCSADGRLGASQGKGKPELPLRSPARRGPARHTQGELKHRHEAAGVSERCPQSYAAPRRCFESRPGPPGRRSHARARRPLSRRRPRRGRAGRPPRRPLLPPSPVEPLPDARGTFGPRSFLLPDFHFSYLVLSHILCAANGSHFRRPGPSTSSAAAPRLGGLQAAALGDVSKSRSPPDGETSTWEASLKAAPCAGDPGVGPASRPGPAEAPPLLRKNRRTLLARVSRTGRPALWRPFSRVSAAAQCPDASSAARERGSGALACRASVLEAQATRATLRSGRSPGPAAGASAAKACWRQRRADRPAEPSRPDALRGSPPDSCELREASRSWGSRSRAAARRQLQQPPGRSVRVLAGAERAPPAHSWRGPRRLVLQTRGVRLRGGGHPPTHSPVGPGPAGPSAR